jgi:hypothetical protein
MFTDQNKIQPISPKRKVPPRKNNQIYIYICIFKSKEMIYIHQVGMENKIHSATRKNQIKSK